MCCAALHCADVCVKPSTVDGVKCPACWQQRRLVSELHLHSWKDNQPTGLFNLKYACWTINHFVRLLHAAQKQGWDVFQSLAGEHTSSVLYWRAAAPKGSSCFWSDSRKSYCAVMFLYFNYNSSWDDGIVSSTIGCWNAAGGLFSQVPRLEFELQLSAPVYQPSGGGCGGRKCYPCREEQKAWLEVWGTVGGKERLNKGRREGETNNWGADVT